MSGEKWGERCQGKPVDQCPDPEFCPIHRAPIGCFSCGELLIKRGETLVCITSGCRISKRPSALSDCGHPCCPHGNCHDCMEPDHCEPCGYDAADGADLDRNGWPI